MSDLLFRRALETDVPAVIALYRSAVGREGCTWDDEYPGAREAAYDQSGGNLYVLTENGRVVGAVSVVSPNELDDRECWEIADGTQREIARVVIDQSCSGRRLAAAMLEELFGTLRRSGCRAVHLSAARVNAAAVHTYRRLGFSFRGECFMYGNHYFLCEKEL